MSGEGPKRDDAIEENNNNHRHPRPRIETLSDLIYGLSLSIGAIELFVSPDHSQITDINKNLLDFLFVFLILITSWIIYTGYMSVLPVETRLVTFLNVVLLILVAIMPYLYDQVQSAVITDNVREYASILFTVDLAGSLLILALFAHVIAQEEKQLVERELVKRFRTSRNIMFGLTLIVLMSMLVPWSWILVGVHVRLLFWLIPIFLFWFDRMTRAPIGVAAISHLHQTQEN